VADATNIFINDCVDAHYAYPLPPDQLCGR
jgi:hypothetical protein